MMNDLDLPQISLKRQILRASAILVLAGLHPSVMADTLNEQPVSNQKRENIDET